MKFSSYVLLLLCLSFAESYSDEASARLAMRIEDCQGAAKCKDECVLFHDGSVKITRNLSGLSILKTRNIEILPEPKTILELSERIKQENDAENERRRAEFHVFDKDNGTIQYVGFAKSGEGFHLGYVSPEEEKNQLGLTPSLRKLAAILSFACR